MTTPKLTPDQLHRLIDEVAALAYLHGPNKFRFKLYAACNHAGVGHKYRTKIDDLYMNSGREHAGLSAVLILLSEGG